MIPAFVLALVDALKARKFDRMYAVQDPFRYSALEFEQRRIALMTRLLAGRRYGRAVEFGCAAGHVTLALAPICDRLLAIDLSARAVAQAKERVKGFAHVSVARGNLRTWRASDTQAKFDLIVLSELLYYLGERNDLLKALASSPDDYVKPVLARLVGILAPEGCVLLAHSHAAGRQADRRKYRVFLEELGLRLKAEEAVPPTGEPGTDSCLVSLLAR